MNQINWKARFKNKNFWLTAIPSLLLLVQAVLVLFGIDWNPADLSHEAIAVVDAVFTFLAALGVVTDPTTAGFTDSAQAMTYTEPKSKNPSSDLVDERGE